MDNVKELLGDKIYFAKDQYDALQDADALMIMTEWPIFRTPQFERIAKELKNNVIFDGRNLYDLKQMEDLKFEYYSIGRRLIKRSSLRIKATSKVAFLFTSAHSVSSHNL